LDEIDHIAHDSNYDPSEFLYRLLRGEGKLAREIQLSAWLLSNEVLEVDLRLDSRVESAMSDETVFFGPYGIAGLEAVVGPQLERAFRAGGARARGSLWPGGRTRTRRRSPEADSRTTAPTGRRPR
jgi:Cdc6-like AAA superfamily ATPase